MTRCRPRRLLFYDTAWSNRVNSRCALLLNSWNCELTLSVQTHRIHELKNQKEGFKNRRKFSLLKHLKIARNPKPVEKKSRQESSCWSVESHCSEWEATSFRQSDLRATLAPQSSFVTCSKTYRSERRGRSTSLVTLAKISTNLNVFETIYSVCSSPPAPRKSTPKNSVSIIDLKILGE